MAMVMLIICLVAPLAVAPLIVLGSRHLFAIFVREASELFVGVEMHRAWATTLGTDMAIVNTIIFSFAWWAAVGLQAYKLSAFAIAAPFLAAVVLALWFTSNMAKSRLKLQGKDALMVGLISFAGGNLPLIVGIPVLLKIVMAGEE